MIAKAVIGASFGDEGKGRLVDWLAAPFGPRALVVRSNGGAQAAHTVVRGGKRHVFHHVGSATFVGARTHLSRFMVSHPILLENELASLRALGFEPQITADPRGYVTTPWDMMVNQAIELARAKAQGDKRHGSCGLGFGETVGRNEETGYRLSVGDLHAPGLRTKLLAIRDNWLSVRCRALGLMPGEGPLEFAMSDALLENFLAQCGAFAGAVAPRDDATLGTEEALIFEGAQGLLLDQNAPGFPFLTRSNTGMTNVAAIAGEAGIAEVEPVYVTRTYLTRHGRGPMEDERDIAPWFAVDDPTNRPNPWQESLRFGLIDVDALGARVRADCAASVVAVRPSLAVTCFDQATGALAWIAGGALKRGSEEAFVRALEASSGMPVAARFHSPENQEATLKEILVS